MTYRIGYCQYKPKLLDLDTNLNKMEEMLNGIEADLIVLPELATSGYVLNTKDELAIIAEDPKSSKTFDLFRALAKNNNTSYVVGFPEKNGERYYNSCFLMNPDGQYFVYRKTHLFNRETLVFTPGDTGFFVVKAKKEVRIGMMICFDWFFPESARTLALRGAQIIAHPSNLVLPWCQQAMITRTLENRVFAVTANRYGIEKNDDVEMFFTGQSQITSTMGEILHRDAIETDSVFTVDIEPGLADNKYATEYNHLFQNRRTELYE